jgi:hypothetical protein
MPTSSKTFPSAQLQTYLKEPRAHSSVPPFTTPAEGAIENRTAEMREYLVAWDQDWKLLAAAGYVLRTHHVFAMKPHILAFVMIFGVLLTPQ